MPYSPLELAAAFIQAGELTDALDALNQQLEHQPGDDAARRLRIGVLKHLGTDAQVRLALADYAQLIQPTADDAIQQSILLEHTHDAAGARDTLAQAHERWPEDERLTERYLNLLLAQGETDTALEVIRRQPRTWRWLQWEGDALAAQGDDMVATARYGLALSLLDDLISPAHARYFAPIKTRLLLARAGAYRRQDLLDQAVEHYQAAGALMPADPTIPFNRGVICWLQGDETEALRLCRAALDSASESLRAHLLSELRADPRSATLAARLFMET